MRGVRGVVCKGEEVLGQKKVGEHLKIMAATELKWNYP